jgi:DNA-binding MarR family transcriptional regulator
MTVIAARSGLTLPQYSILMVLAYAANGLSVGSLASRLRVSQPFITAEIGKLVTSKLVLKRSNPADKRGVLIALSPRGIRVTSQIASMLREVNDIIYRDIPPTELDVIKRFIVELSRRTELGKEMIVLSCRPDIPSQAPLPRFAQLGTLERRHLPNR